MSRSCSVADGSQDKKKNASQMLKMERSARLVVGHWRKSQERKGGARKLR